MNILYTYAQLRFPQIDKFYNIKPWCPYALKKRTGKTWNYYEDSRTAADPIYVILNDKNNRQSL